MTFSTKNKINNENISSKVDCNNDKIINKNSTISAFENNIINKNSSNSSNKEKKNKSPSIKNLNSSKKTLLANNSKISLLKKNNNSSNILDELLKGIISLKKNNFFDYIIRMLKLILFYYKSNSVDKRNNLILDDTSVNIAYQNIFQSYKKDTYARKILTNYFKNNKQILKNIHFIFIFYIYCGIEHINDIKDKSNNTQININNCINFNELLSILFQFMFKENCKQSQIDTNITNINTNNKSDICIICSKIDKIYKSIYYRINNIDKNKNNIYNISNMNFNNIKKSTNTFNITEKVIFDYNHKYIKDKFKIKKNNSNFINSDSSLKAMESNYSNKSYKTNNENINQNNINYSNDKRILNYLKTAIDEKIKNNCNSHRTYEVEEKEQKSSELKNYISYRKSKSKNSNYKSVNKIYNYSCKNNVINIIPNNNNNSGNIKENNSQQNFFTKKNINNNISKLYNKNIKMKSNININNNHQIFLYPKVEQYLNNVYIINDNNNKNINEKFKENKNELIYDYNNNLKSNKKDIDEYRGENDISKYIEIINSQIKNMENIFDDFKTQTMKIKQEVMDIGNRKKN